MPTKKEARDIAELYNVGKQHLMEVSKDHVEIVYTGEGFERGTSRPPYRVAMAREDNGCKIYGDSHTGTVLYELTGRGCEILRKPKMARWFVAGIADRVSRVDFAVDVRTGIEPSNFANARDSKRFRTIGFISSDTGQTAYLGSPKSDRFARVYRYRKPHPRAHLLRVEFVFRRKLAKAAAEDFCISDSDAQFVAQLGNTWGLQHSCWQPGVETDERLLTPIVLKDDADTIFWLYKQVAPAMSRLLANGALDMTDFLDRVFEGAGIND